MGEYISREAMLKNLTSDLEHHSDEVDPRTCLVMRRFIKYVEDFPAADVQPVKRGRWESPVSVGNGIKFCSVCRNEAYWDTDYGQQLFDYCPYCGARMDGDKE